MPLCQYRRGGDDILYVYKKRWYWLGYSLVECTTSRRYAVSAKIVDKIHEIRELVSEYERLEAEELLELDKIGKEREDPEANRGDPKEMSLPKNHGKFKKLMDEPPTALWYPVARLIKKVCGYGLSNNIEVREGSSKPTASVPVERVTQRQEVGDPNKPPKNKGKGKNNNQQDHQH